MSHVGGFKHSRAGSPGLTGWPDRTISSRSNCIGNTALRHEVGFDERVVRGRAERAASVHAMFERALAPDPERDAMVFEGLAAALTADGRRRLPHLRSKPITDTLHRWLRCRLYSQTCRWRGFSQLL